MEITDYQIVESTNPQAIAKKVNEFLNPSFLLLRDENV